MKLYNHYNTSYLVGLAWYSFLYINVKFI